MKTTVNRSATKTTKAPVKDAIERPYSLVGVENMASVKGLCLTMNAEESAQILQHVKTKYARLPLAKDVVLRLPTERKNAVLLKATDGTLILRRTSDLFQTPLPILSEASRAEAREAKKALAAKRTPSKVSIKTTVDGKKATPKMLQKAMDEVKNRAAKGASSATVKVVKGNTTRRKATPATAPVASPATATVAVAPSTPAQS